MTVRNRLKMSGQLFSFGTENPVRARIQDFKGPCFR